MHHTLTGKKSSHQQNYTFVCKLFGRDILLTRITPKRGSDLFHFHSFTKYPCGSLWPVSCKKFCPSSQCPRFHRCKPLGPDSHIKFLKDSSVARHGLKSCHWNFQLYIWFMWATKKTLLLFMCRTPGASQIQKICPDSCPRPLFQLESPRRLTRRLQVLLGVWWWMPEFLKHQKRCMIPYQLNCVIELFYIHSGWIVRFHQEKPKTRGFPIN